ncbi:MAG: hypothetical protein R2741_07465 [Methanolobus sp.]
MMVRLENEIATMEENGEDVEDLETMLEEYRELYSRCKGESGAGKKYLYERKWQLR